MPKISTRLRKPRQLRDFDKNPMMITTETGHKFMVYNQIVERIT